MAMVLFIVRFMEWVWTLYVLGGGSGEVGVGWGGGGDRGLGGSGHLYLQKDDLVSISPSFICHIENSILDSEPEFKPTTYCHYIDNIFIITDSIDNLLKLKQSFKETSILTFTYEIAYRH